MDIAEQMDNWTETLAQKGLTVSYEGAKFGYVTMTRRRRDFDSYGHGVYGNLKKLN